MARLGDIAEKIRSKNAGPFWLTIDIFCGSSAAFEKVRSGLKPAMLAKTLGQPQDSLAFYALPDLNTIKISLPRPQVQGSRTDRDMHGAQWGLLVAGIELD